MDVKSSDGNSRKKAENDEAQEACMQHREG